VNNVKIALASNSICDCPRHSNPVLYWPTWCFKGLIFNSDSRRQDVHSQHFQASQRYVPTTIIRNSSIHIQ
jgi:hypothetical protein